MAKVTVDHDISTFSNSTHESMWGLTFALCVPKFIRIHDLGLPDKRLRMRQTATDCESSTDHHVFGQRSEVRHINLSSCSPQKPGNIIWKKQFSTCFLNIAWWQSTIHLDPPEDGARPRPQLVLAHLRGALSTTWHQRLLPGRAGGDRGRTAGRRDGSIWQLGLTGLRSGWT